MANLDRATAWETLQAAILTERECYAAQLDAGDYGLTEEDAALMYHSARASRRLAVLDWLPFEDALDAATHRLCIRAAASNYPQALAGLNWQQVRRSLAEEAAGVPYHARQGPDLATARWLLQVAEQPHPDRQYRYWPHEGDPHAHG